MIECCYFVFLEVVNQDEIKIGVAAKPKVSSEKSKDLKYSGNWVNCPDFYECATDYPVCIPDHDACCPLETPNYYRNLCYALDTLHTEYLPNWSYKNDHAKSLISPYQII